MRVIGVGNILLSDELSSRGDIPGVEIVDKVRSGIAAFAASPRP